MDVKSALLAQMSQQHLLPPESSKLQFWPYIPGGPHGVKEEKQKKDPRQVVWVIVLIEKILNNVCVHCFIFLKVSKFSRDFKYSFFSQGQTRTAPVWQTAQYAESFMVLWGEVTEGSQSPLGFSISCCFSGAGGQMDHTLH